MITATIYKNNAGDIYAFKVKNHDTGIVCAAVSVLTINTVNSIEQFTDEEIKCSHKEKGGYLSLELPRIKSGGKNEAAALLLNSMLLGLNGVLSEYPKSIRINVKEADKC